jgi:putative intracellular protease/amidase
VDHSIKEADSNHYDLILLAGGNITPSMLESASLCAFLKGSQGTIAASCASAVLLAASGLINGPYTCIPQTKEKFSQFFDDGIYTDADVCINERIITCKGLPILSFDSDF